MGPRALVIVVMFAGCFGPDAMRSSSPRSADSMIALSLVGKPQVVAGSNGTMTEWTIAARANGTRGTTVGIDLSVGYQKARQDAGGSHAEVAVPDVGDAYVTMRASYIGFGHYYYDIVAHNATGEIVGHAEGMWERCPEIDDAAAPGACIL